MQDDTFSLKKPGIRDNKAPAGGSEEKQPWHAPVLRRLDVELTAFSARHSGRVDGYLGRS